MSFRAVGFTVGFEAWESLVVSLSGFGALKGWEGARVGNRQGMGGCRGLGEGCRLAEPTLSQSPSTICSSELRRHRAGHFKDS